MAWFFGDGCSPPTFGLHHCYPNYVDYGSSVSTSWYDTSTDSNWTAWGHAGFWVNEPGFGFTSKIDTPMPYTMIYGWNSTCYPNSCS